MAVPTTNGARARVKQANRALTCIFEPGSRCRHLLHPFAVLRETRA